MSSLLYGTLREPLTDRPALHAVGAPSFGVFQSRTFRMGSSPVVRRRMHLKPSLARKTHKKASKAASYFCKVLLLNKLNFTKRTPLR